MTTEPRPGERLSIDGKEYAFTAIPGVGEMVFAEAGRHAQVYRLMETGTRRLYALKVFFAQFRQHGEDQARLRVVSQLVAKYRASYPGQIERQSAGLAAAERTMVAPERNPGLMQQFPQFAYSILMPWISGDCWTSVVLDRAPLKPGVSYRLAVQLAGVLAGMERRGLAHCNLSGGNVLVGQEAGRVELVDLEDMYWAGRPPPAPLPAGMEGYVSSSVLAQGLWSPVADRLAGAILLTEMLGWQFEDLRQQRGEAAYFTSAEFGTGSARYRLMTARLGQVSPEVQALFERAWASPPERCPPLADWQRAIGAAAINRCPSCGQAMATGWRVCTHCGHQPTRVRCPRCETESLREWSACYNCGEALGRVDAMTLVDVAGGASRDAQVAQQALTAATGLKAAGRLDEAIAVLEQAAAQVPAAIGPPLVEYLMERGHQREQAGNAPGAIQDFTRARELSHVGVVRQSLTAILQRLEAQPPPAPAKANRSKLLLAAGALLGVCLLAAAAVVCALVAPSLLAADTPTATVAAVVVATGTPPPPAAATLTPSPVVTPTPAPTETATDPPTETATPTLVPTATPPPAGFTRVWPSDSAVVVYVPAGPFLRGSLPGGAALADEQPQTSVSLSGYWIDQTEVTVAQYRACVDAGVCAAPQRLSSATAPDYFSSAAFDNFPVIYVIWQDAVDYCRWAGRRLPSEAQWEKAARGTDGRVYPWGDAPPAADLTNFGSWLGDTSDVQASLGDFSPYGVLNLAGNVREWVADWYDPTYYATGPSEDPRGPSEAPDKERQFRVYRGGSWRSLGADTRTTARFSTNAGQWLNDLGFRCAADP